MVQAWPYMFFGRKEWPSWQSNDLDIDGMLSAYIHDADGDTRTSDAHDTRACKSHGGRLND